MAKGTMKMPDEFLMKLTKLGDKTDEIVSKVLEAGGEVVLDKVKANLKGVIGNETKEKADQPASWYLPWASLPLS